ncbi:MAG: hypothetical protein N838_00300 [Thiohalocapsa sp. PB-PSB1]|jgi:hypothetical protein|nr:MAG: hypothetical protein N838_00300 [Thiohalocapsa sp. PB-PSB1]
MFSAMAFDAHLRSAQALILRVTLSFHMLALALGPADRLDGRTLGVELLMHEWHRAYGVFSLDSDSDSDPDPDCTPPMFGSVV